jgi:hypothetical protein
MKASEPATGGRRFTPGILQDGRYIKTDNESGRWEVISKDEWRRLTKPLIAADYPFPGQSTARHFESSLVSDVVCVATAIVGLGILATLVTPKTGHPHPRSPQPFPPRPEPERSPAAKAWAASSPRPRPVVPGAIVERLIGPTPPRRSYYVAPTQPLTLRETILESWEEREWYSSQANP